jgi:hypothetical protein
VSTGGWLSLRQYRKKVMFGKGNVGSLVERRSITATIVPIILKVNFIYP